MEFDITRREPTTQKFTTEVLDVALDFTKLVHKELGDLIRGVVLFGSATHSKQPNDIDILIIIRMLLDIYAKLIY